MKQIKGKRSLWVLLAGFSAVGLSACGSRCEDAQKRVIEPIQILSSYLNTQPKGEDLVSSCETILENINGLPEGADTIRQIAQDRYVNSYAVCSRYATGVRLVCNRWYVSDAEADFAENSDVLIEENSELEANASGDVVVELMQRPRRGRPAPRPGYPPVRRRPVCRNLFYSYCVHYEYGSGRNGPMFNQAMDLAKGVDEVYFKSNEMCQKAYSQNPSDAENIANQLQSKLGADLITNGYVFYRNACGN